METPIGGINPRIALATSMQASPGVYAVLLGSGISSAAGIPTGWQVVEDLIRRVARAQNIDIDQLGRTPEAWWLQSMGNAPKYGDLLASLAPTTASRQSLLKGYFEPSPGVAAPRAPTAAHHALAELCAWGFVRVIVTTNFDRLMEHALDEAGVAPQVIDSPNAARTMTPLVHSAVTVVKVHGDYLSTGLRNTAEELGTYPLAWRKLLGQIFDEYGLIVVGWSGEYDTALVKCVSNVQGRRYPMYWGARHGKVSEDGQRIINRRDAYPITLASADEFLTDLRARLERLEAIARRHREFVIHRYPLNYPNSSSTSWGWSAVPLLIVRTYAILGPITLDDVGVIGPEIRERLDGALASANVMPRLLGLRSQSKTASAITAEPTDEVRRVEGWITVDGYQSTNYALYRWGGDCTSGVSALFTLALPEMNRNSGIGVTFDVGVSIVEKLPFEQAASLLREGVLLVASDIWTAVADLLPPGCEIERLEGCFGASNFTGVGDPGQRSNDLTMRVDWSNLGPTPSNLNQTCGFAVTPGEAVGPTVASQIVADGLYRMALSHGFLDPRGGIAAIRGAFGLDPSTGAAQTRK